MAYVEEKGDWLAALVEPSEPAIRLAGRVPVPVFRADRERDSIESWGSIDAESAFE
jgi:hypothetical protein